MNSTHTTNFNEPLGTYMAHFTTTNMCNKWYPSNNPSQHHRLGKYSYFLTNKGHCIERHAACVSFVVRGSVCIL